MKKLGPLGLRLVEGLRGPALHIVKAVKEEVLVSDKEPLWEPFGPDTSKKPESSTSLDPEHGILSRQLGDPMSTYTMRRRSWYAMLTDLDSEIKLPELLLAEQILMNAGVTEEHLLMIKTSLGQIITVDGVCNELLNQHGNIPQRENKARPPWKRFGGKGNQPWKGKWEAAPATMRTRAATRTGMTIPARPTRTMETRAATPTAPALAATKMKRPREI